MDGVGYSLLRTQAIVVPRSLSEELILHIRRRILMDMRPVCNAMVGGVHASHKAHARRRTNRCRIGVGELHSLLCQSLHVWSVITPVEFGLLRAEWQRSILPPHIIDKEQDDIRSLL